MISLRKHIEDYHIGDYKEEMPDPGVGEGVVSELRATLLAIGQCADRAVPGLGVELNQKMTGLQRALVQPVTARRLTSTNEQARSELSHWADQAFSRHRETEREMREIVTVLSAAAESVSERDDKYAREIGAITGGLSAIAKENDLAIVRRLIVESTRALNTCMAKAAGDSKASVNHLTVQVKEYRARFEEAERVSQTDPLTNLANRRAFEKHLAARIGSRGQFCLIMIDLNDFKEVNDRYGHLAGDDLLKQFAGELKSQFTPADMVGRWGGDEFIVVTGGQFNDAQAVAERVRKWTLGEYKVGLGERRVRIFLRASIGVAVWDGMESGLALLARVDQAVYLAKRNVERTRV